MKGLFRRPGLVALVLLSSCQPPKVQPSEALLHAQYDELARVTLAVNRSIQPGNDIDLYGRENWVMEPASGRGDCDDYALTKLYRLSRLGFGMNNMRVVTVQSPGGTGLHAVLEVRVADGSSWFLDNLTDNLQRRLQMEDAGYRFFW